ncbi:MAG: hypothetical protein ACFFH0_11370 [Promethearchaeota archaeon]
MVVLFTTLKYPTKTQSLIWFKRRKKVKPSDIADELDVSRAFVSKSQRIAKQRIMRLIEHAASINRVELTKVSAAQGFAFGYCPSQDANTYITYSPKIGVQIWLDHVGDCGNCSQNQECERILRALAEDWGLGVSEDAPPTLKAKLLFEAIMRELNW